MFDKRKHLVGHISERHIYPRWRGDDGTAVAEYKETILPMVCCHTRVAHAAKRYVVVGNVHNGVIDACAAGRGVFHHKFALCAKIVECQRLFSVGNEADGLI